MRTCFMKYYVKGYLSIAWPRIDMVIQFMNLHWHAYMSATVWLDMHKSVHVEKIEKKNLKKEKKSIVLLGLNVIQG